MGREDRQDINKIRKAGSDVPARGKNVTLDDAKPAKAVGKAPVEPKTPKGYKGSHREKGKGDRG